MLFLFVFLFFFCFPLIQPLAARNLINVLLLFIITVFLSRQDETKNEGVAMQTTWVASWAALG